MDLKLNGKTVFISGGSSGIGQATALAYAREPGVQIAISYYQQQEAALETVRDIERLGARATAVQLDLSDPKSQATALEAIGNKFGGIDVLISNAVQWPTERHSFVEASPESWDSFLSTNLMGVVRLCQAVVPNMKQKNWGRIVLVSSDVAIDSLEGFGAYSTAKAALSGLAANLVVELSSFGILTNVVLPSWTLTDRTKNHVSIERQNLARRAFPTRKVTTPEDVASMIVYLGSGANGHVNGEQIKVTGGASLPLMTYLWDQAKPE
jgi:NAD(P)-dependent dehydrogenase (short-subunit alcohol dehydrogenase family)